jgi:YidC/Oxa1 family membrane protein insertase
MASLFNTVLYQPLLNLLVFLYDVLPGNDIGLAIVALTIIIKLILHPLSRTSLKQQRSMMQLQPKIEALKVKYKDNKEQQAKELMNLYKQEKVNPLSSCLPVLVQLPFLIAVFKVFQNGLNSSSLGQLYSFVPNPGHLDPHTFGGLDLSHPVVVLALLAGLAQYWQAKMLTAKRAPVSTPGAKDENMMAMMNKQMTTMMPIMTVFIGMSLPGGLSLYWLVMTLATALQQKFLFAKDAHATTPAIVEGEIVEKK